MLWQGKYPLLLLCHQPDYGGARSHTFKTFEGRKAREGLFVFIEDAGQLCCVLRVAENGKQGCEIRFRGLEAEGSVNVRDADPVDRQGVALRGF